MAKRDYYEVLGVGKTAAADEVKKAHRKLARQFHPDMNKDVPDAARRFQEVQEAYDVLSDPTKRAAYDQFGHGGPAPGGDPFGGFRPNPGSQPGAGGYPGGAYPGGGYPGGGRSRQQWTPGGGVSVEDFDAQDFGNGQFGEIFEQLFGGKGPFGRQPRGTAGGPRAPGEPQMPRPADIEYPVTLTFEQAARGTTLPLKIDRGDGRGESIEIKIPAGVKTASRVRLKGRGERGPGGASGDLFIIVNVTPSPLFRRDGMDVLVDAPVGLFDALLGGTVDVPTLDAKTITLRVPAGTGSGTKIRMKGRGIFRGAEKGDQLVVVQVTVPKDLTDAEKALVEQLRDLRTGKRPAVEPTPSPAPAPTPEAG